jgi:hypothetical protein
VALPVLEGDIQRGQQGRGGAEGGHRVRLDKGFHDALVHRPQVDALAEIVERAERTGLLATIPDGGDRLDGPLADVLDGGESEADPLRRAGGIGLDGEEGR